jgi:hypothetical protein
VRADKGLTEFTVDFPCTDSTFPISTGNCGRATWKGACGKRAPLFTITATPAKYTYRTQYIPLTKPTSFGWLKVEFDSHLQSATMKDREKAIVRNLRRRYGDRFGAFNDAAYNTLAYDGDILEAIYSPGPHALDAGRALLACEGDRGAEQHGQDHRGLRRLRDLRGRPIRLKDGIKTDTWQVELEGNPRRPP